jgi:nucleoside-diphosphate-sugar epimerase
VARTLVTGGCGLLGSAIADRLLEAGEAVVVADLFEDTGDGRVVKEGRAERLRARGAEVVRVDLSAASLLWPLFADHRPSAVVNAALFAPDGDGLRPFLSIARAAGIGFFVHLSDGALYGEPAEPGLKAREDEPLPEKDDPSLRQKGAEEELLREAAIPYTTLRVFPLMGPGFPEWRFPGHAFESILLGDEVLLPDDEPRDFVHIDDAARAALLALRVRAAGATVNVGSGLEARPSDLLQALAVRSGRPLRFRVDPEAKKPVHRVADTTAAWELLKFAPQRGIGDAVEAIAAARFRTETTTSRPRREAAPSERRGSAPDPDVPRAVSRREIFNIFRRPFDRDR